MKKFLIFSASLLWSLWCVALVLFHWGTLTPPTVPPHETAQAHFYKKTDAEPLQHLVLIGSPFARGKEAGQLTKHLLYEQEKDLTEMLKKIFPWRPLFHAFELMLIPLFKGVETTIPNDHLLEMYGVSLSTDPEFDDYAEAYTRQIAYHGLHEVGQMMVDQYQDDRLENMGCTAILVPYKSSWLVGRNFDFEGGRTLDEKKILKWVFPTDGQYAFVSAIWSGMVGAVTAVNEHGLFVSINAAGSKDFNRHGLPSTLLVTQVMTSAKTATEALEIIKSTPIMITEIFVVVSRSEGKAFRVEKSPTHTEVIPILDPKAVTNHLHSEYWKNDATNIFRSTQLTSHYREARGEELAKQFPLSSQNPEDEMAKILRDKNAVGGEPLPWGNRRAIDPMIANHSVIYNASNDTLFVSSGPHITERYVGYDLTASFKNKKPVFVKTLARDQEMTPEARTAYLNFTALKLKIQENLNNNKTSNDEFTQGHTLLKIHPRLEDMRWNELLALREHKNGDRTAKNNYIKKALSLSPPYARDQQHLEGLLHAL